jgi:UDP-N-acetylmuramate dehydrogenase
MNEKQMNLLRNEFGVRLQENVQLANYTTINVGGPADALLIVHSAEELEKYINKLWNLDTHFVIVGSGSNILISDRGIRGVVVINHAHNIKIQSCNEPIYARAESGTNMATLSRQCALRGLSGLEWAVTLPGTVGGAVYGNAGAFGQDVSCNLLFAEILQPQEGKQNWSKDRLEFGYRSSILKRMESGIIILSATFHMQPGDIEQIKAQMEAYKSKRLTTQPIGASMGSVFRNPEGDKAGRLIEAAGLKGKKIGEAEISPQHANFIMNRGKASAKDILDLINLIELTIEDKFSFHLQLEIQFLGDWDSSEKKRINQFSMEKTQS